MEKSHWQSLFPRAYLEAESLDFSFSGLKSAVKRYIDANPPIADEDRARIAFAFEHAVFDVLIQKILTAAEKYRVKALVLAGGVSANSYLKGCLEEVARE